MSRRFRFIIVGSGWRSLYYVRIAKALPERFELCAMLCRTAEKAERMAAEHHIRTTTSAGECIDAAPDLVVVAVDKAHIAAVAMEWLDRGFTVLAETPASLEEGVLREIRSRSLRGQKLVTAEQYRYYPENLARRAVLDLGLIGDPDYLYLSAAHEYHGISLIRHFLGLSAGEPFSVKGMECSFPTRETLTRYERITDGRIAEKKRTLAVFSFANGKTALYDFDPEQYRSPIRRNLWKIQGCSGEIQDTAVRWLEAENRPAEERIRTEVRRIETEDANPNLRSFEEVTAIYLGERLLYEPPFGACGLSQDETAIAVLMWKTGLYAAEEGPCPYPVEEALADAWSTVKLREAIATGAEAVVSRPEWL